MRALRATLALAGVGLLLLDVLAGTRFAPISAALFTLLVALSFFKLNRIARVFFLSAVVVCTAEMATGAIPANLLAAIFPAAFLLVSGSLRTAASHDPAINALGQALSQARPNRQFAVVSLSTGLLAVVFLNGALQFVSGTFARKVTAPLPERLTIARTIISGFALNPILSPLAIPSVVITSMLPAVSWLDLAPYLLGCGLAVWLAGRLQIWMTDQNLRPHAGNAQSQAARPNPSLKFDASLLTGTGLILAPILATIALAVVFEMPPSRAAFTCIFATSLVWPVWRLRRPDLVSEGYSVSINEATILGSSLVLGSLLLTHFPPEWSDMATGLLSKSGGLAPALILLFLVSVGFIGVQPAIAFLLAYPVVGPYVSTLGADAPPIYAALILGWALNSLCSPIGLPVMIVCSAFSIRSLAFTITHGWVVLLLGAFGGALSLLLVSAFVG